MWSRDKDLYEINLIKGLLLLSAIHGIPSQRIGCVQGLRRERSIPLPYVTHMDMRGR